MKSIALCLEAGEHYLKIVAAESGGRHNLLDVGVYTTTGFSADAVEQVLRFLAVNRFRPRRLFLSVPRSYAAMRTLHLPSQNEMEIKNMIQLHLGRIVPYKPEEVFFSYLLAGADDLGYSRVVIAVVQSELIKKQLALLEQHKLYVDAVALGTYGCWHWAVTAGAELLEEEKIYVLLEIDALCTDFIVFDRQTILFSQSISVKLTDMREDAGQRKLLGEVRQLMVVFGSQEADRKPSALFVSGIVPDQLPALIEAELELPTRVIPGVIPPHVVARQDVFLEQFSLTGAAQLCRQAVPATLALTVPELEFKKNIRRKTREIFLLFLSILSLAFCVVAVILARVYVQQDYAEQARVLADTAEQKSRDLSRQATRNTILKEMLQQRQLPFLVLGHLQRVIPESIALYEIALNADQQVQLRGQAINLSDVFEFVSRLEQTADFEDVQTKRTRNRRMQANTVTEFDIQLRLR